MIKRLSVVAVLTVPLVMLACSEDAVPPTGTPDPPQLRASAQEVNLEQYFLDLLDEINAGLTAEGLEYRAGMVEYLTGEGDEAGATVISKDVGNKQLAMDFVPFDPRRAGTPITNGGWSGSIAGPDDDITYAVDMTIDAVPPVGGLTGAQTDAAIDRAMATWDGVNCSTLPITRNPDFGVDIGVVAFIFELGGSPFALADVQHAGWRDINFGGGVLGATFTFFFIDGGGNPTDIDNDGTIDTAFREIYYDPTFNWADDGVTDFDVEAVALHEAGHGLSQAHFGNILIKNKGSVKRAPAAVMNPFILGQTRTLLGTDSGGHCSNWGQWPNN